MRLSFHANIAIIIIYFFIHNSINQTFFILGATFIDFDYFLSKLFGVNNHRRFITHNLWFWLLLGSVLYISEIPYVLFFCYGAIIHILLDMIDWGIFIYPFGISPHILQTDDDRSTDFEYSKIYWNNVVIRGLEILAFIFTIMIIANLSFLIVTIFMIFNLHSIINIIRIIKIK